MNPRDAAPQSSGFAWPLVLCLVGLDYFSTLAYLPSLAVQATGPLAPLGAALVAAVTLLVALPVYWLVAAHSPHGQGGIGIIERMVPGWAGKLLVLFLLAFVATDFIVTQNLSTADAAEHLRANPYVHQAAEQFKTWTRAGPLAEENARRPWIAQLCDPQLLLTLVLSAVVLSFWTYWTHGSPAVFLRWAALVVLLYLVLNAIVIGSALVYLSREGEPLVAQWFDVMNRELSMQGRSSVGSWSAGRLALLALFAFPHLALGLSGFELSMAVAPLVRGSESDDPQKPVTRIRGTRRLLIVSALIMSIMLTGAVFTSTLLVPAESLHDHGPAVHRTLAYLAHGGMLADGRSARALNPWFGPGFGSLYDLVSVWILCLAGAGVAVALRDFVPEFLKRLGMEMEWAHLIGVKMRFFNVLILAVTILFRARIEALQWVYVTSVLVLLSSGSLAAALAWREIPVSNVVRGVARLPYIGAMLLFVGLSILTIAISRAGLEIAISLGIGIFATSAFSRWRRSTELRFSGFEFTDPVSEQTWQELCGLHFQALVPHRPGRHTHVEKEQRIRKQHRLPPEVRLVFIEAELGDPSDFYHIPLMRIVRDRGSDRILVSRCASIAHVIAAIAVEMTRVGSPPEIHFGWSDETPLAANLNFLLFGQGNVPWMVRELIRKAIPDAERRPRIFVA